MIRRLSLFLVLAVLVSLPSFAQESCNLQMTATCSPAGHNVSNCTSTTLNAGNNVCTGQFIVGFFVGVPRQVAFLGTFSNSLGLTECIDPSFFPPDVEINLGMCFGASSLAPGQSFTQSTTVHAQGNTNVADIPVISISYVYDDEFEVERGAAYAFANIEQPTCTPRVLAPPVTNQGISYTVSWTAVSDPSAQYIVEESTSADFSSNVTTRQVNGLSTTFRHDNMATTTTYYYRVRATHCSGGATPYSEVTKTVVQAPSSTPSSTNPEAVVPFGSTEPVQIPVFIPGASGKTALADSTFTVTTDKSYLTVTPSTGILPAAGTTVIVTANPTGLKPGANTGTLTVTANGVTTALPVQVSLVTPVSPVSKSMPPGNALIIPVVTHVNGATGPFLSDVRLTNSAAAGTAKYMVTMTPTRTSSANSKATQVTVDGNDTIALNDIAKNFFGFGATGAQNDVGFGALEIRPLEGAVATFASSRTYASTAKGTFGQYIAAVPFSKFATNALSVPLPGGAPTTTKLSLQQIAQSAKFRTNFGIVEGSGTPASGNIHIFDAAGTLLKSVPFSLQAGEHQQINNFVAANGIPTLEEGRLEVEITSETGAVTAYASVLDNLTTDPLAVMPVDVSKVSATRYTLPGMTEFVSSFSNFHSDIRVFNGGPTAQNVTFTFYPEGKANEPVVRNNISIPAGTVRSFDSVMQSLFGESGRGGSIVLTTAGPSSLVATGRTYSNDPAGGTFGQFIPGVTAQEGIALGQRPLQILQLEQSAQFRTNLGLAEVAGQPVEVRVTLYLPETKATPSINVTLQPGEFRQLGRVIESMNPGSTYNARMSVEVISGAGRVTAYGSVVDMKTSDPTYVPAQ